MNPRWTSGGYRLAHERPPFTWPSPGRGRDRWQDTASAAGLLADDGSVAVTIFAEMSALAVRTGAINLGQGFPDVDGPEYVKQAAIRAIEAGRNQYAPGDGVPELRQAIAEHQSGTTGWTSTPTPRCW